MFPFLDLLGDGHTSFNWAPTQMISSQSKLIIRGSRGYGVEVHPSRFEPCCDAYERSRSGGTFFKATAEPPDNTFLQLDFGSLGPEDVLPYPVEFFRNVTSQPQFFKNTAACVLQVRIFDSPLSRSPYRVNAVRGNVTTNFEPWARGLNGESTMFTVSSLPPLL